MFFTAFDRVAKVEGVLVKKDNAATNRKSVRSLDAAVTGICHFPTRAINILLLTSTAMSSWMIKLPLGFA